MRQRGHGRGVIAAIGLLLLFAGLVGGGVLWVLADREPESAAESFARAVPGCTTTLTFGEPGEFYVFEELSGIVAPVEGCQPSTLSGRPFTFTVVDSTGVEVPRVADDSVSYDLDVGSATSVARITIEEPGEYRISVLGSDPATVAAVGGDPEAGVEQLRQAAIASIGGGLVLGAFLLWLSARRSRRAATFASPADPGWGVTERDHARRAEAQSEPTLPAPSGGRQVPVNPMAPDERRVAQPWSVPVGGTPGTAAAPAAPPIVVDGSSTDAPETTDAPDTSDTTPVPDESAANHEHDVAPISTTEPQAAPPPGPSPAVAWPSDLEPSPERDDADESPSRNGGADDTPA